jgi:ribosomal protein RSM22 (predicted rRNA methylase)
VELILISSIPNQGIALVDKTEAFDRLMISPQKRGRHVIMKTCDRDGELTTRIISKADGLIYKEARKVPTHTCGCIDSVVRRRGS